MKEIEKIKKEIFRKWLIDPDGIDYCESRNVAEIVEDTIKLTAKEILDEVENVKHFCRTFRKEEWINVGVFENHLEEVRKSFGVENSKI